MAVKCSACGYANYNPDARACELCHAKLGGGAAESAGKIAESGDDLARLTAEALEEEEAAAKKPAAAPARAQPAAPAGPSVASVGAAAARGAGGLDILLFALSLPLTFPAALWVLLRGRGDWQAVPVTVWLGQGMLVLTGAATLTFMSGGDAAWARAAFPVGLGCAFFGGLLLVRIGEQAAGWGTVGTLLGGACLAGGTALAMRAGPVFEGHTDLVRAVAVSADGKHLATAGEDGAVRLWDVARRAPLQLARAHTPSATAVRLDPASSLVVSGGADGLVLLWDGELEAEPRARVTAHRGGVTAVDYHHDKDQDKAAGRLLTGGVDGFARVWSAAGEPAELGAVKLHRGAVTAVAWSPDGKQAASGGADGIVFVWQAPEGRAVALERHKGPVLCLTWSRDGERLVSGGEDGLVCVWSPARPREAPVVLGAGASTRAVCLIDGGKRLVAAHDDRALTLWDVAAGQPLGRAELPGPPAALAVSPDGATLFVAVGRTVRALAMNGLFTRP
ncbi:MAG: WD40 repeat domain-containing protein [Planctomycetes bacterium]|nr:WD40 repeat domain-containing protein [Planctomycetota bacterium]